MSFQAYLDNVEAKTGRTPNEFIAMAKDRGYDSTTKSGVIVDWLKEDFDLGRGHAMASFTSSRTAPKSATSTSGPTAPTAMRQRRSNSTA